MIKYSYVIEDEYGLQTQLQCLAPSFDVAWDIARSKGQVIELWEATVQ